MIITREWAMPSARTFTIAPIRRLLDRWIPVGVYCLDPFPYEYTMDAIDYLAMHEGGQRYAVFDPPYSPRQLKEMYRGVGEYDTKASTWSRWKDALNEKMGSGGIVVSFGWSTNGMGKTRGYEILEILLVAHGGMHNDTICVVERKS